LSRLTVWMDRTFYPDFQENWDDILFRERILSHLRPEFHVLDVGAGAGIVEQMRFKGHVAEVCGIDLDARVRENPHLDDGRVADAGSIPYEDNRFDLVFADNVMEHLDDPETVFSEIKRVLKPEGILLFKTPNRSHYMPLISRMTPHGFHLFYNRLRGREETDTFPTHYLANSKAQVEGLAEKTGLELITVERIEGRPEYLRLSALTYAVGLLYERIVNALPLLALYRIILIAVLRKPV
jgi:SAM-dependent methyltransferase